MDELALQPPPPVSGVAYDTDLHFRKGVKLPARRLDDYWRLFQQHNGQARPPIPSGVQAIRFGLNLGSTRAPVEDITCSPTALAIRSTRSTSSAKPTEPECRLRFAIPPESKRDCQPAWIVSKNIEYIHPTRSALRHSGFRLSTGPKPGDRASCSRATEPIRQTRSSRTSSMRIP